MPEGIDWNCLSAAQSLTKLSKDIEKSQNWTELPTVNAPGWNGKIKFSLL